MGEQEQLWNELRDLRREVGDLREHVGLVDSLRGQMKGAWEKIDATEDRTAGCEARIKAHEAGLREANARIEAQAMKIAALGAGGWVGSALSWLGGNYRILLLLAGGTAVITGAMTIDQLRALIGLGDAP